MTAAQQELAQLFGGQPFKFHLEYKRYREYRMGVQEWTIKIHQQHQPQDKQNKKHNKEKKNTDHAKKMGISAVARERYAVSASHKTPPVLLIVMCGKSLGSERREKR